MAILRCSRCGTRLLMMLPCRPAIFRLTKPARRRGLGPTKPQFVEKVMTPDLHLVIATAEIQVYANVLITVGVVSDQIGKKPS